MLPMALSTLLTGFLDLGLSQGFFLKLLAYSIRLSEKS